MLRRYALVLGSLMFGGLALSASIAVVGVPPIAVYEGEVSSAGLASGGVGAHALELPTAATGAHLPIPVQGSWERLFSAWGH